MRNWLSRVMYGRNGVDQMSQMCSIVACVLALISIIGSRTWLSFLWWPAILLYAYAIFRMFSRNLYKRQQENNWYLEKTNRLRSWFRLNKTRYQQRKDYVFFSCPNCKTTVRVPKGKGNVTITCPKCREKFSRKS